MSSISSNHQNTSSHLSTCPLNTRVLKTLSLNKTFLIITQIIIGILILITGVLSGLHIIEVGIGIGLITASTSVLIISTCLFFLPKFKKIIKEKIILSKALKFKNFENIHFFINNGLQKNYTNCKNKKEILKELENTISKKIDMLKKAINNLSIEIQKEILLLKEKQSTSIKKQIDTEKIIENTNKNLKKLYKELENTHNQEIKINDQIKDTLIANINDFEKGLNDLKSEQKQMNDFESTLQHSANYISINKESYKKLLLVFNDYSEYLNIIVNEKETIKKYLMQFNLISEDLNKLSISKDATTVNNWQYHQLLKLQKFTCDIFLQFDKDKKLLENTTEPMNLEKLALEINYKIL